MHLNRSVDHLSYEKYCIIIFRPLNENLMNDDHLVIEVWDFDPAETIGEKMSKILDIKGVRGFRKLMKEIAVTASTGKHDNELIGRCSIPLKVRLVVKSSSFSSIDRYQRWNNDKFENTTFFSFFPNRQFQHLAYVCGSVWKRRANQEIKV